MNYPFSSKAEIFKWGPVPFRLFYASDFNRCLLNIPKNYPGHSWPKTVIIQNGDRMVWLNDHDELKEHGGKLFLEYMLPSDKREKIRALWKKNRRLLEEFERRISKLDVHSLSNERFMEVWRSFHQTIVKYWQSCVLPELSNYGSSEILQQRLKKYIKDESELMSAMEVLTAPIGLSFYQEEDIDLAKAKDIEAHQKKYFWLKNSYAGVHVLDKKFFAERKTNIEKGIKQKVFERLNEAAKNKKRIKQKYALPKEIIDMANAIADGIVWQDARKKDIWICLHYKDILLGELARRYKLPKRSLLNFDSPEIENLLKNKNINRILKIRDHAFGMIFEADIELLDEKTALKYWNKYVEEKAAEVGELKGVIVSKGIAKGKAKIVLDPSTASHFQEGDVLVAPMTTPDYIFIMKRASAIVTDTGGLTSHAAIVSRELGIPCIVGTGNATRLIKDGDLIEVDANKGIVRKLK